MAYALRRMLCAVCFGRDTTHNSSVPRRNLRFEGRGIIKAFRCARLVMERSPHSVLVGEVSMPASVGVLTPLCSANALARSNDLTSCANGLMASLKN